MSKKHQKIVQTGRPAQLADAGRGVKTLRSTSANKHTPTPWHLSPVSPDLIGTLEPRKLIVEIHGKNREADAEFVLRAVNNHDALVAALEASNQDPDPRCGYCCCAWQDGTQKDEQHSTACQMARAAIANAKEVVA